MNVFRKAAALAAVACFAFCTETKAQEKLEFSDMGFEEAKAKAKASGKVVFVDVRGMNKMPMTEQVEKEIFTADSVAGYLNEHCVNITMNMNSEEGKEFAKHLVMLMYPVYVFYDGNGTQLDFINAATILKDPAELLQKARASVAQAKMRSENTRSITFSEGKWKNLLAKAKKENKLVFLDAYTEWCRPCIMMAKNVFTLNHVADYYNEHFINAGMDMEKGEGPALAKKFNILAYPTYIFVDGDGNLVYRASGYMEADAFIEEGKQAVNKQKNK